MEVALRKRDANSGAIEKRVDAVTEFTPHAAAVHRGTEAHPELQAEHERIVAEILQQQPSGPGETRASVAYHPQVRSPHVRDDGGSAGPGPP